MIRVVEEKDEVAEADQRVRAVPRTGQVTGVSVHVTDYVNSVPPAAANASHVDQP